MRYEPVSLTLRNTVGLLGLTALGAALFGAALSWVAPLIWTLIAVLPFMEPSRDLRVQVASWLIQPAGTTPPPSAPASWRSPACSRTPCGVAPYGR